MIATVGVVKEEPVEVAAPVEGEAPAEPEVIGKGKKEEEAKAPKRSNSLPIADLRLPIADWNCVSNHDSIGNRQLAIGNVS